MEKIIVNILLLYQTIFQCVFFSKSCKQCKDWSLLGNKNQRGDFFLGDNKPGLGWEEKEQVVSNLEMEVMFQKWLESHQVLPRAFNTMLSTLQWNVDSKTLPKLQFCSQTQTVMHQYLKRIY